jgi:hypothetical protein
MSLTAKQFYELLPAVYRTKDAPIGQLQALFEVLAEQSAIVEDNIEQLYADEFIETCAPWVIPYIGDLIGYNSIYEVAGASADSRAEVANTIGYRRRKGTLIALEQVSIDVSGRAALGVEEFLRMITTVSMRHVRAHHDATVDLRDRQAFDPFGTAFDQITRTVDVRRIAPRVRHVETPDAAPLDIALHGPGRYNIPNVAIHVWRWQSYLVTAAPAFVVGGGRYKFSPLGNDMPLFSLLKLPASFTALIGRVNVPQPIGRDELMRFYGPERSVELIADGVAVDSSQIVCANLADRPGGFWCTVASGKIAIDPVLGRIQYAADVPLPQTLQVTYCYGFPADIGGGPYDRTPCLTTLPADPTLFAVVGSADYPTLVAAVAAWNALPAGSTGTILLPDYMSLTADLTGANAVQLPAGSSLAILAGSPQPSGGPTHFTWSDSRAVITGNIEVTGVAPAPAPEAKRRRTRRTGTTAAASPDDTGLAITGTPAAPAGQLLLSSIWLAGQLQVDGQACTIQVADCTLVPGLGLLSDGEPVSPGDPSILISALGSSLVLNRAISGPIAADSSGTTRICASIIDATTPFYVAFAGTDLASAGADLHIEDSTVIGKVRTRTMTLASNTIFRARLGAQDPWPAAIWASRRQVGCERYCWLPFDSITPRRYGCLPPDQASQWTLEPHFVSLRYGDPSYALLSGDCPMAVWTGADNGSQIGVYLQIQETEAVSNVQLRAPEYLPALLESGIFLHPAHTEPELEHAPFRYGSGQLSYGQPAGEFPGIGADLIWSRLDETAEEQS